ncbi:MAG TPA: GatB/YqeY domain-containing protein [Planctomycetota bacterium]|jgi:hypothetical protein|nr:GatB/YqeY domain-containing protein [Planctomycetota bacterium]
MGPLGTRIEKDLREAMKARDAARTSTLRMLVADLRNEEMRGGATLDEAREFEVLRRALKARHDAAEGFDKGSRPDAAAKERAEAALIETYLPKLLSASETEAAARVIAAELGLASKRDMGRLMKELLGRHRGRVDGKVAQEIAARVLA